MELNKDKIIFRVQADDKNALQRAIDYVNLQAKSDYEIIDFKEGEVGLATITVSEVAPEFLFMLGKRYEVLRDKPTLNF